LLYPPQVPQQLFGALAPQADFGAHLPFISHFSFTGQQVLSPQLDLAVHFPRAVHFSPQADFVGQVAFWPHGALVSHEVFTAEPCGFCAAISFSSSHPARTNTPKSTADNAMGMRIRFMIVSFQS
jgi:hypothetical protein